MASYTYDETGHMALFFIITVLFMVLVPVTFSQISLVPSTYVVVSRTIYSLTTRGASSPEAEIPSTACECSACDEKRTRIRKHEKGTFLRPKFTIKCVPLYLCY